MLPRQRPHEAETVLDETLARGSEGLRRKESGGCSQDEQIRVREDETTRALGDRDCALGQLHTHTHSPQPPPRPVSSILSLPRTQLTDGGVDYQFLRERHRIHIQSLREIQSYLE